LKIDKKGQRTDCPSVHVRDHLVENDLPPNFSLILYNRSSK